MLKARPADPYYPAMPMTHSKLAQLKAAVAKERAKNEERLSRSLSFWESFIAQCNVFYSQWANSHDHPALDKEAVQRANEAYETHFPSGLAEKAEEALLKPQEYKQRIAEYERSIGVRPYVPFPTDQEWYSLIVNHPLRIEEELFVLDSLLDSRLRPSPGGLRIVDLGTGNGRMIFRVSGLLSGLMAEEFYRLFGLDRELVNLGDCSRKAEEKGMQSRCRWLTGDMARLPLQTASCDFILAASCLNLVPEYERPLVVLEMLRCLQEGGEVIVSGPNERFSAEEYIKCTVASNLDRYLLPWNLAQAQNLGQIGLIIDDLVRERLDCSYLQTDQFCETLQIMDCQLQRLEHWPRKGAERNIFSGIRFQATAATKRRMQRYERQLRKEERTMHPRSERIQSV